MSGRINTYSPIDVVVIIQQKATGVVHQVSGFADDSQINIERGQDTWKKYVGVDNDTTRTYSADESGMATLSLAQTSSSNDVLYNLYNYDKNTRNGQGLFSVTIKDASGRSIMFAKSAWIGVVPNQQFGADVNTRDWVIHCASMVDIIGGNGLFTAGDASNIEKLGGTVASEWIQ